MCYKIRIWQLRYLKINTGGQYGYTAGRYVLGVNVYYRAYCTCLRVISWPRTRLWSPKCRNFLRYYCTQRLQMLIVVYWSVSVGRKSNKRIDTFFAFCCIVGWIRWYNLLLQSLWWSSRSDPSSQQPLQGRCDLLLTVVLSTRLVERTTGQNTSQVALQHCQKDLRVGCIERYEDWGCLVTLSQSFSHYKLWEPSHIESAAINVRAVR